MNKLNNEASKKENALWPIGNKRLLEAKGQILSSVNQQLLQPQQSDSDLQHLQKAPGDQLQKNPATKMELEAHFEKLPHTFSTRLRYRGDSEGLFLRGSSCEVSWSVNLHCIYSGS